MNKYSKLLLVSFLFSLQASAYELGTHARMTESAFAQSVLSNAQFLGDMGIDVNSLNTFGDAYYDVSGSSGSARQQYDFEKNKMPNNGVDFLTVKGWLMRGAIREDDAAGEKNPQDDLLNPTLKRPLHHFYDPVTNRPLTVPGLSVIDSDVHAAPNWAVGGRDVFTQPNTAEANRRNHFTVFDAREAMYRALTGRNGQGDVVAVTEAERNKYWATTFRALGDVVHLVQDMGQPQHTRNDPHSGVFGFGHKSIFEEYIEARATGAANYSMDKS